MTEIKVHHSSFEILTAWLKRQVWKFLFSDKIFQLGSFFVDPRDHIGAERIITGNFYEDSNLKIISELVDKLGLQTGTCVDVGANIGNHACFFASKFNHVVCFEPGNVANLVLNANLLTSGANNFTIYKYALGNINGHGAYLKISDTNLGSSQIIMDSDSDDIEIKTGDELFSATNNIAMIKIDVEGAEIDVLSGFSETLMRNKPLICIEILSNEKWVEAYSLMCGLGYTKFLVSSQSRKSNILSKLKNIIFGRNCTLALLPEKFPETGYDMIFCLTEHHFSQLNIKN